MDIVYFVLIGVLIFIVLFIVFKIYEHKYYKSEQFLTIKKEVEKYVAECNELNQHIEELKSTYIINNKLDYGESNFKDKSKWKFKRPQYAKNKFAPQIHHCSRNICDGSRKKPFQYVCKYFNIGADEENLSKFEQLLNNFEAAITGKELLINERTRIVKTIKQKCPIVILSFGDFNLIRKLGFEKIDLKQLSYPKYIFRYVSPGGNASYENSVELNIANLNKFITYLSENIKFRNSIEGQRALLTSKLRKKILERDGYRCQCCGASIKTEPNLLLEIDHKIPLSKGGLTTEDNLQALCWRCNRKKGNKIIE